jgi:ribosomal protein L30/L7E
MSSPAACNKPLDIHKSVTLKQTKQKKGGSMKVKSKLTKRSNAASVRLKKLNKNTSTTKDNEEIANMLKLIKTPIDFNSIQLAELKYI